MSETIKSVGLVLAGIVVGLLVAAVLNGGFTGGGVYSNVQKDFSEGITVDGTVVIDGNGNVDAPITSTTGTFSGDVTVTTSNTATSSIEVGCIDTYATSTATAVRLSATTTPGIAYWTFGTCADL